MWGGPEWNEQKGRSLSGSVVWCLWKGEVGPSEGELGKAGPECVLIKQVWTLQNMYSSPDVCQTRTFCFPNFQSGLTSDL